MIFLPTDPQADLQEGKLENTERLNAIFQKLWKAAKAALRRNDIRVEEIKAKY